MIAMLGAKDGGAPGALVQLDNDGNFVKALPAPKYMYDVGVKPELNLIVTSSWAHPHAVKAGNTPMDQVGDEVVAWDWKTGKVLQVEHNRKSTRLNSSHSQISYAVFCLKKKNHTDCHHHSPHLAYAHYGYTHADRSSTAFSHTFYPDLTSPVTDS